MLSSRCILWQSVLGVREKGDRIASGLPLNLGCPPLVSQPFPRPEMTGGENRDRPTFKGSISHVFAATATQSESQYLYEWRCHY
ncbi:hypothetical protein NG796_18830 [Laspinema sp. A4]|uniref:hypothetical protein n=1 Tax=Laspinema sp. D2d TaxID=2953686 RepID=UPI0021BB57C9|nr:hypothetical protein [Laspinema sp. D2d]MCT7985332.1 hypothetical protein [Laspinema sp. D2d]